MNYNFYGFKKIIFIFTIQFIKYVQKFYKSAVILLIGFTVFVLQYLVSALAAPRTYDITKFGALGDGKTLNTLNIQESNR